MPKEINYNKLPTEPCSVIIGNDKLGRVGLVLLSKFSTEIPGPLHREIMGVASTINYTDDEALNYFHNGDWLNY